MMMLLRLLLRLRLRLDWCLYPDCPPPELGVKGLCPPPLPIKGALNGRTTLGGALPPPPTPPPPPAAAAAYGGGKSGILRWAGVGTGDLDVRAEAAAAAAARATEGEVRRAAGWRLGFGRCRFVGLGLEVWGSEIGVWDLPAAECVDGGASPALLLIVTDREGSDGDDARRRAAEADDDDVADCGGGGWGVLGRGEEAKEKRV